MKTAIKKEFFSFNIPMILILLMTYLDSTVFSIRHSYSVLITFISSIIIFLDVLGESFKKKSKVGGIEIYALIMMLIVLIRNYDIKHFDYTYEIVFIISALVCTFDKRRLENSCNIFLQFSYYFGFIACIVTFICYFSPNFYMTNIYHLATKDAQPSLLYSFEHGYYAGFALHYSSNGIFLGLFCGAVFAKILQNSPKIKKDKIIILVFGLIGLFLTAKRAHVIFSILAIFVVYYIYKSDKKKSRLINIIGIIIASLSIFSILSSFIPELNNVFYRLNSGINNKNGGLFENRNDLYKYALLLFSTSPLFGHGWNSYKYFAEKYLGTYIAVHNVYLQLLAETGICGAIIFYVFFVISLVYTCKMLKFVTLNKEFFSNKEIGIYAFAVFFIVFFLTYSITGNALYESRFVFPFLSFPYYCIKKYNLNKIARGGNNE